MKTIIKSILFLLVIGVSFQSCDKSADEDPLLENSKTRGSVTYFFEEESMNDSSLDRSKSSIYVSVAFVGRTYPTKYDENGRLIRIDWLQTAEPYQLFIYRSGNLDKIEGYELYKKKYPDYIGKAEYCDISFDKDTKVFNFSPSQDNTHYIVQDIESVKYDYEEDCLFVTVKTPLRGAEKAPATYKLKHFPPDISRRSIGVK